MFGTNYIIDGIKQFVWNELSDSIVNILNLKTILFIPQNMFQSKHSSSFTKISKNCKYSKFTCLVKMLHY